MILLWLGRPPARVTAVSNTPSHPLQVTRDSALGRRARCHLVKKVKPVVVYCLLIRPPNVSIPTGESLRHTEILFAVLRLQSSFSRELKRRKTLPSFPPLPLPPAPPRSLSPSAAPRAIHPTIHARQPNLNVIHLSTLQRYCGESFPSPFRQIGHTPTTQHRSLYSIPSPLGSPQMKHAASIPHAGKAPTHPPNSAAPTALRSSPGAS